MDHALILRIMYVVDGKDLRNYDLRSHGSRSECVTSAA